MGLLPLTVFGCFPANDAAVKQGGDGDKSAVAQAQQGAVNLAYNSQAISAGVILMVVLVLIRDFASDWQLSKLIIAVLKESQLQRQLTEQAIEAGRQKGPVESPPVGPALH